MLIFIIQIPNMEEFIYTSSGKKGAIIETLRKASKSTIDVVARTIFCSRVSVHIDNLELSESIRDDEIDNVLDLQIDGVRDLCRLLPSNGLLSVYPSLSVFTEMSGFGKS